MLPCDGCTGCAATSDATYASGWRGAAASDFCFGEFAENCACYSPFIQSVSRTQSGDNCVSCSIVTLLRLISYSGLYARGFFSDDLGRIPLPSDIACQLRNFILALMSQLTSQFALLNRLIL